jgi:UDP-2-acetamido-3-amino-2,3-dideoxy-glucuronate N-acetyltransferase
VIHPTAEVEAGARLGAGTRVWHFAHIRSGAVIGENCNIGYGVYIDADAVIGNNVKLQNRVSIYRGVTLEDGVFVGPNATFTNDKYPRAITPEGEALSDEDWQAASTVVRFGASIGAGAVVLPGITIGRWAMVGAGSLVTADVPDQALVVGVPGRHVGYACLCGRPLDWQGGAAWRCPRCHKGYSLPEVRHD